MNGSGPSASPPVAGAGRVDLLGLSRAELAQVLVDAIDRPFRVDQIYRAIHERGALDFAAMTDLPQPLRERLAAGYSVAPPAVHERQQAPDGTTKYLLRLADGASIEAVDIPTPERRTLCISSQAGCALACRFCVTGFWGAGRNLTAGEIVGQVLRIRAEQGSQAPGLNLVFMGMGEPLLNLAALVPALERLAETISWRRMTVSTAGIVPGIEAMAGWPRRPNLAISLHAPDDRRRSELMPINRTYPLAELLAALRHYPLEPGRQITFEYILIAGYNDARADADALVRLVRSLRAKVNLIPLNPDPVLGDLAPPSEAVAEAFLARLRGAGLVATLRRRRGGEVAAACGQLRAFAREPRSFAGRSLGRAAPQVGSEPDGAERHTSARLRPAPGPSRR